MPLMPSIKPLPDIDASMFEKNDYLQTIDEHYAEFIGGGSVSADLSGWENSPFALPIVETWTPPTVADLSRYYVDSGQRLKRLKARLIPALEILESDEIEPNDFTLIPSATSGIAIVLAYLKEQGVKELFVEAPTYYAVMDAAGRLGIACNFVAPLESESEQVTSDLKRLEDILSRPGVCLWLHQPRYALGCDLNRNHLEALSARAVDGRFLVLDEANDDTVPSLARTLHRKSNVLRLRSLTKVFGLNGVRIALLLHPAGARDKIVDIMWSVGGALDWFSVSVAESVAVPKNLYADMLRQMHERLLPQRRLTIACLRDIPVRLLPGETGFLGSIRLDWRSLAGTEQEKRSRLIHHMAARRIPVMLGAHVYMPKQIGFEHIRLNFLNTPETLREGISAIQSFFSSVPSS